MSLAIIARVSGELRVFTAPDDTVRCTVCTLPEFVTRFGSLVAIVGSEGEHTLLRCPRCHARGWFVVKPFRLVPE